MKVAGTSFCPFTDFTQANYDTLTRLKWRWLASKISDNNLPEEEKAVGELPIQINGQQAP
jgi:hypothetical protein